MVVDLNTILSGLILSALLAVIKVLWDMHGELVRLHGRLDQTEQWQAMHEAEDRRAQEAIRDRLRELAGRRPAT